VIPIEIQAEILTRYFSEKQSLRLIALELGLNRRSIARIIQRRSVKNLRENSTQRYSVIDPFKEEIRVILAREARCSAAALFNRIRSLGYEGSASTLRSHLRKTRLTKVRPKEGFLRLDFAPGETAQVD